jgi:hypothetical protein
MKYRLVFIDNKACLLEKFHFMLWEIGPFTKQHIMGFLISQRNDYYPFQLQL